MEHHHVMKSGGYVECLVFRRYWGIFIYVLIASYINLYLNIKSEDNENFNEFSE